MPPAWLPVTSHRFSCSAPLDREAIVEGSSSVLVQRKVESAGRRSTEVPSRLTDLWRAIASPWWFILMALLGAAPSAQGGVLVDITTGAPNNNDYIGTFESNPNFDDGFNVIGFTFDHVLAVQPSGGTTEYSLRRGGNFTAEPTDAITLELGFGVGENFLPASDFFGLGDFGFDIPLPGDPPPTSSVFSTVEHEPYRLTFTNGFADGFASGVADFSIDVPDLDPSLNEMYFPEELPENFPADATAFTLRMRGGTGLGLDVAPAFADAYSLVELGPVEGAFNCCGAYAGVTFLPDDPNVIIFGINAGSGPGELYRITVNRDGDGHITGFAGSATKFADTPRVGSGLQFGPGGVLFRTLLFDRADPTRELGQLPADSTDSEKFIDLAPLGGADVDFVNALSFVPVGLPGEGQLKVLGGRWLSLEIEPDGGGTFEVAAVTPGPMLMGGFSAGISYVPLGSPIFGDTATVLISEGNIFAYDVDANGDPIPETGREFVTGIDVIDGSMGSIIDPLTGDLLFTATPFFADGEFFVVRGFAVPVPEPTAGSLVMTLFIILCCRMRRPTISSPDSSYFGSKIRI